MKIADKLKSGEPSFSFEFFPPKNDEGLDRLFQAIAELKPYEPTYVSVTYGAGGSTRRMTVDLVRRIKQEAGIETMAHLTCVGATRQELLQVLAQLEQAGIENVLALGGDPPKGEADFVKPTDGLDHATELIELIRAHHDFCLVAACYPEVHPEAVSAASDLEYTKRKVELGAEILVTQLFFDNADYFRFVDRARAIGIDVPIIAGIMPVTNLAQIKRFTAMCGSTLPQKLIERLERAGNDPAAVRAVGVEHATRQCRELLARGAPGVHFYTLNRSTATREILTALRS